MPTTFVVYGSSKPLISVLGEFDALPSISQKPEYREQKDMKFIK